tara:strand:+ start:234 stop:395 length:162 start_codon:yes stop_codon:yes gene_type:complete
MTYPIHNEIPTNTLTINDIELDVIKSALFAFSNNPAAPLYEVSVAEQMLELIK